MPPDALPIVPTPHPRFAHERLIHTVTDFTTDMCLLRSFLVYYGSYRDYTNPNLNGILRTYSIYCGRTW